MDILLALFIGAVFGALVMAFINGSSETNKINEAYTEGFLEGQREAEKE